MVNAFMAEGDAAERMQGKLSLDTLRFLPGLAFSGGKSVGLLERIHAFLVAPFNWTLESYRVVVTGHNQVFGKMAIITG